MTPTQPIIGIPTHSRDVSMAGLPPAYIMGQSYVKALAMAGGAAIMLPLYEDLSLLRRLYGLLDGLFLAGGSDLNPALYAKPPHPKLGILDHDRDRVELELIRWAFDDGLPVLAVCRGVQALNVARGGTLYQDIASEVPGAMDHYYWQQKPRDYLAHDISIAESTRLRAAMGVGTAMVNSLHHQSVQSVGADLRVSALAEDGVIEALEASNGHFAVGVQWHPEALVASDEAMLRLFSAFVDETQKRRSER
jgi:putative glutamine amidotransferase